VTADNDYAAAGDMAIEKIPVVDISSLCSGAVGLELATEPGKTLSDNACKALNEVGKHIHKAATEVGFFYINGHGIDDQVIHTALAVTQAFFNLSKEQKQSVLVNQQQRGWMPAGMAKLEGSTTHDLKEVFFYGADVQADDPDLLAGVPLVALNQWPDEVMAELQPAIEAYHRALCQVGVRVLSAIAVGFGLAADVFARHYEKPLARGQLVYYPPSQSHDEQAQRFGVAPHTDFGVLTLLFQDDSGGLQVKTRAGQWIEAPPIAGTLVCNTGDLLQRWTNDRFASTVHRVINRSGHERYSMPVFFDPSADAVIDPIALGVAQEQAIYGPISTGEHIQRRNRRNFKQYGN